MSNPHNVKDIVDWFLAWSHDDDETEIYCAGMWCLVNSAEVHQENILGYKLFVGDNPYKYDTQYEELTLQNDFDFGIFTDEENRFLYQVFTAHYPEAKGVNNAG